METQRVNKTVRGCCEGWGGPRCSQGNNNLLYSSTIHFQLTLCVSILLITLAISRLLTAGGTKKWTAYWEELNIFPHHSVWLAPFLSFTLSPVSGPGVGVRGHCYSTWSCEDFPGVHNSSLMPMEQCCGSLWGLSWKNASDQTCLSCTYTLLAGQCCRLYRSPQRHLLCQSQYYTDWGQHLLVVEFDRGKLSNWEPNTALYSLMALNV